MKKILLSTTLCSIGIFSIAQAPTVQWEKAYQDSSAEILTPSHDGGIITIGSSANDFTAKKFNLSGELQWERTYDIASHQPISWYAYGTSDGGYTFFAEDYNEVEGAEESDFYLVKINAQGELQWSNLLDADNVSEFYSMHKTTDGGFLCVIEISEGLAITKLNSSGAIQWSDVFDSGVYRAIQTSDEGFLYAGLNNEGAPTLAKLDASRNVTWQKPYTTPHQLEFIYGLEQTMDGGYVVLAELYENTGDAHSWLVKLDASGEVIWEKTLLNQSNDHIKIAANNDILIAGYNKISRFDSSGNLRWEQMYDSNYITDLIFTNEGGFAYASENTEGNGSKLVKLSSDNLSVTDLQSKTLNIYPNPVNDVIHFSEKLTEIKIYDLSGKLIKNHSVSADKLNVNDLPKGNYIMTGTNQTGNKFNQKFIKL